MCTIFKAPSNRNHGNILISCLCYPFVVGWLASQYYSGPKEIVQDRVPNETNYNINIFSPEEIEEMSPREAKALIQKLEDSDLPSLGHRDFYALKAKADLAE